VAKLGYLRDLCVRVFANYLAATSFRDPAVHSLSHNRDIFRHGNTTEQKMMRRDNPTAIAKFHCSFILCLVSLLSSNAHGQVKPISQKDGPVAHQKALTFDVVSIRPSHSQEGSGVRILPDGYQAKGMSLETTILIAYFPAPYFKHQDELKGYPSWVANETYDIEAKVSPADLVEWQRLNQNMMQTSEVLQHMLRAVLAERCKLVIHSVSAQVEGYVLTADKSKLKLEEQSHGAPSTSGMKLLDGGTALGSMQNGRQVWTFSNTSMTALVAFLSFSAQGPMEDRTGLQGKYHFVLTPWIPEAPSTESTDQPASDPGPPVPWDLDRVGLKVSRVKVPMETWVVDSMQRPSSN